MERNRWETAIRCLEMALHPNTADDEVIAAVAAFRRVVNGRPLRDVCAAATGGAGASRNPVAPPAMAPERLNLENRELRRRLADAETARTALAEQLTLAQRRLADSEADLRAARDEAAASARRVAEIEAAQSRAVEHLRRENAELRQVLAEARRAVAGGSATSPFDRVLAATLQRGSDRLPPHGGLARPVAKVSGRTPDLRSGWVA